jgi:hypothetical protein
MLKFTVQVVMKKELPAHPLVHSDKTVCSGHTLQVIYLVLHIIQTIASRPSFF